MFIYLYAPIHKYCYISAINICTYILLLLWAIERYRFLMRCYYPIWILSHRLHHLLGLRALHRLLHSSGILHHGHSLLHRLGVIPHRRREHVHHFWIAHHLLHSLLSLRRSHHCHCLLHLVRTHAPWPTCTWHPSPASKPATHRWSSTKASPHAHGRRCCWHGGKALLNESRGGVEGIPRFCCRSQGKRFDAIDEPQSRKAFHPPPQASNLTIGGGEKEGKEGCYKGFQ